MMRLFIHIVILLCISLFAFERYSGRLFNGLDGPAFLTKTEIQQSFFSPSLSLRNDVMEGLSSATNDFNLLNKPALSPALDIKQYAPYFYTWYALQLFLTVLIIGWNYQFSPRVYYTAAWLLTLTLLPYFQDWRIYSLSEAAPCFFEFIFVFALMDVGLQRMGNKSWRASWPSVSIFLLGLVYGLIFCPSAFVIIAPILFITTIHAFLKTSSSAERYRKLFLCILLLFAALALGWVQYAVGLILDSAASFFHTNITGFYHSKIYASILYIGNLPGSYLGPYLFCGATLGMICAIFLSRSLRILALLILICQLILAGGGAYVMSLEKPWSGPSLIYFEMILFPFYGLFLIYLIDQLLNTIFYFFKFPPMRWLPHTCYFFAIAIAIVSVLVVLPTSDRHNSYTLPPRSTPLIHLLKNEIELKVNQAFSGRVVNILPNHDWLAQCAYFASIDRAIGNDHQASGLWFHHIPTLHSYHQEISPGFFSFYRRFLTTENEAIYRNWTSFSKVNTKILRLLGVKFILTTEANLPNLKLRATLNAEQNEFAPLYLYQLSDVNVAGISAKQIVIEPSISAAENRLAQKNFDLSTAVVIEEKNLTQLNLTPAIRSSLRIVKNGFQLTAESNGQTLLILPLEFNHCMNVISHQDEAPKLIRVDGILLGVLFNKKINSTLRYQASPFNNAQCKLKNYLSFKKSWQGTT